MHPAAGRAMDVKELPGAGLTGRQHRARLCSAAAATAVRAAPASCQARGQRLQKPTSQRRFRDSLLQEDLGRECGGTAATRASSSVRGAWQGPKQRAEAAAATGPHHAQQELTLSPSACSTCGCWEHLSRAGELMSEQATVPVPLEQWVGFPAGHHGCWAPLAAHKGRGLDWMTSRCPFQPPVLNSEVLWLISSHGWGAALSQALEQGALGCSVDSWWRQTLVKQSCLPTLGELLPAPAPHPPSSATTLVSEASLEGAAAHRMIHCSSQQDKAPEKPRAEVWGA